ncbi:hypothetical protein PSAC2689_40236 [Paraburkholderia sacchari]
MSRRAVRSQPARIFAVPDEKAHGTVRRLQEALVGHEPVKVQSVSADDAGSLVVSFSRGYRLFVISAGVAEDEDWRFFATGVDAAHFVIKGGTIAAESFE